MFLARHALELQYEPTIQGDTLVRVDGLKNRLLRTFVPRADSARVETLRAEIEDDSVPLARRIGGVTAARPMLQPAGR